MNEVNLEALAQQLEEFRREQREMRAALDKMAADLEVLTRIVLGLARDVVQVKDILARIDGRSSPSW
jgi:wobble nucleotide-excising tRNase